MSEEMLKKSLGAVASFGSSQAYPSMNLWSMSMVWPGLMSAPRVSDWKFSVLGGYYMSFVSFRNEIVGRLG